MELVQFSHLKFAEGRKGSCLAADGAQRLSQEEDVRVNGDIDSKSSCPKSDGDADLHQYRQDTMRELDINVFLSSKAF